MKGEERLWRILHDKLEMLRTGNRLPEAIRVGETALELAQRTFPKDHPSLALSYELLGQIYDQQGHRAEAKPYLAKALQLAERVEPIDQRTIHRMARRLAYLCDLTGSQEEAITYYEKAIHAEGELGDVLNSDLARCYQRCLDLSQKRPGKSSRAVLPPRS